MKFTLLIYGAESQWNALSEAEQMAMFEQHGAYSEALVQAGLMVAGEPLDVAAAAKRVTDDGVQDGPYADTKEQLGGFYVIEADSMKTALDWAAKCPRLPGDQIEVRPVPAYGDA
ncbi:YciI family protein [Oceanicaulis alexandrii]|uniref:YciI family protein n=1 Tax=Oceanicaulis alexandrii TaxID=153233 RepID=UPI0035CF557A